MQTFALNSHFSLKIINPTNQLSTTLFRAGFQNIISCFSGLLSSDLNKSHQLIFIENGGMRHTGSKIQYWKQIMMLDWGLFGGIKCFVLFFIYLTTDKLYKPFLNIISWKQTKESIPHSFLTRANIKKCLSSKFSSGQKIKITCLLTHLFMMKYAWETET